MMKSPIDVWNKICAPFALYSPTGEVKAGARVGLVVGVGVGVAVAVGDGLELGDGELEGPENKPEPKAAKAAKTITTIATMPIIVISLLFLAFVCGLFLPHSGLT